MGSDLLNIDSVAESLKEIDNIIKDIPDFEEVPKSPQVIKPPMQEIEEEN